ncbi:MAG TPA: ATP synthase F1 subunit gamma [Candidatus Ventricola intestinavium]|nr:ATP synthase F1 subunit gamma [Candidatus Ventricola intestinavium]
MAGASMKDIKLRIRSVEGTMQITKAMELVASSKLRRAKARQERCRPYYTQLKRTLDNIEATALDFSSPFQSGRPLKKRCLVVIAGDRGLAGGYNSNVLKAACERMADGVPACVLPIGRRAVDFFKHRGMEIVTEAFAEAAGVSIADCFSIGSLVSRGYLEGQYDEVAVVYTQFVSMLVQTPAAEHLLPLRSSGPQSASGVHSLTLYEPSPAAVYDAIVPNYVAGMLYGALCESVASELGARRTAMDSASKNAEEMIEDLNLRYNRARQGAITQEITEIVAGAEH